ncbi:trypco2 family protein [Yinghuangia seranimata]|uniref:trypco2 family protein n=1 Tax=Yinghuangia seranimata TaxID=408067 RepID=UPI00248BEA89|nr:trypco2 family protein [Yinghuangia seranimata]MDI2127207.1 hypothetical protein [Yinghuangia seranimata]
MDTEGIDSVELADAVQAVRDGLLAAAARGAGQAMGFEVGPIRMSFTVEIRREKTGKGGAQAWVVSGERGTTKTEGFVQQIEFTLTPRDLTTGDGYLIAADEPADTSEFFGGK